MLKEYNSLVHETKAIEHVDLSTLDQENVALFEKRVQMGARKNVVP
jgi:hypothetical protein